MDSIGHRRLRPESAFTFPEQAARIFVTLGAERSLCAQATLSHGKLVISSTGSSTHLDCTHRVAW